ncbi:hypothetical protein FE633_15500 [Streptomyces montanus]|uniref:PH domain-containing protein n=1 Tax=Streptomyces montanus TaxID=2580423 RepID=A0A5R9FTH2_9ACTN|nr:hypothetical protein [Streptomyces montanus]TLS45170.1 hypothetical protein FE633_15500 [Streptomyces montanus]
MDAADGSIPADGLLLPAERGRRLLGQVGVVLAVIAGVLVLEVVMIFVVAVLMAGSDMDIFRSPGVAGYLTMPVLCGVLITPLLPRAWAWPALRIDERGLAKEGRSGVVIAPWAALEAVQFTRNRNVLVLRVRPGAEVPGKRPVPDRASYLPYYSLGDTLRPARRRAHHDAIVAAVERFAPGIYNPEPIRLRVTRAPAPPSGPAR